LITSYEIHAAQPQLFFFTKLAPGASLLETIRSPGALEALRACGAGVAIALTDLDAEQVAVARLLTEWGIPLVAWLCLPIEEGFALNLANYPHAAARYQAMRAWIREHDLQFRAIGLAIEPPEPPADETDWSTWRAVRDFARGLWLARDNALYPAARAAYYDLMTTMHHDGYEVHTYQLPFVADDRRAGATLMQRALDILDLPADVDVLLCNSHVPIDWLDHDLGGALIASYGPVADAIGIGAVDLSEPSEQELPWSALRRDLLLAAQHTETIYIASLEYCVRNRLLTQIANLRWNTPAQARPARRMLVGLARGLLLLLLLAGRYGRGTIAWAGWFLALVLWVRGRRKR
jgi:hypothetical protein